MNQASPPDKLLFYQQVWALVRQIPSGKVATYGQITTMISRPDEVSAEDYRLFASRWVGLAMASCPDDVPWQRVVNSQGKISHPEAGKQIELLQQEGVFFRRTNSIYTNFNGGSRKTIASLHRAGCFSRLHIFGSCCCSSQLNIAPRSAMPA